MSGIPMHFLSVPYFTAIFYGFLLYCALAKWNIRFDPPLNLIDEMPVGYSGMFMYLIFAMVFFSSVGPSEPMYIVNNFHGLIVTDGSFVSSTRWNQITRWIFTIRLVTHLSNFVHLIMPLLRITAVSRKSGLSVSAKIRGATFRWFPLQIRDQNSAVFLQMSVVSRLEVWNAVS